MRRREIGCEDMNWLELDQDRVHRRGSDMTVTNFRVP
jgi:hypothetical protein